MILQLARVGSAFAGMIVRPALALVQAFERAMSGAALAGSDVVIRTGQFVAIEE